VFINYSLLIHQLERVSAHFAQAPDQQGSNKLRPGGLVAFVLALVATCDGGEFS